MLPINPSTLSKLQLIVLDELHTADCNETMDLNGLMAALL